MADEEKKVEETPDPATPSDAGGAYMTFETEKEHDAYLTRMIKERLERKERQIEERLEREREDRQREARQKVLEEQEDWKKLAEERTNTISEKDKRIEELSTVETERDSANERIASLEERLKGIIKPRLEAVPELYRPFVESMTVEEQAEWLEKNGEKLETPATPRPSGSPPAGKPQRNGGADTEQAKGARESQRTISRI